MTVERRAGAPRLIDWTGERYVPWTDDIQLAYEHQHRYRWAASFTAGCRVLDVGSGEGFGSAILAATAETVHGIDIDDVSIAHSQLNYSAPNLEFRLGSALELDDFDDDAFDVVIAFEVLEHLVEHEQMLEQIDRVLAPDGVLVISTPDRRLYSEAAGHKNPFHKRELSEPEFRVLLAQRFCEVGVWGQLAMCGSRLGALDPGAGALPLTVVVERCGDDWREAGAPAAMYLVAVASRVPFALASAESILVDHGIQVVRQYEHTAVLARADAVALREELEGERTEIADARATLAAKQREIASLADAAAVAGKRHSTELAVLNVQLAAAVAELAQRDAQLAASRAKLVRVEASVAWSAFQSVRWKLYSTIGEHSLPARALQASLRGVGRVRAKRRAQPEVAAPAPAAPRIRFPLYAEPVVSIVIAAHVGADVTEACLRAISADTDTPTYEVIVVDDAGDDANRELWATIEGARVIVNEQNLGYLRSVNLGAVEATGRHIVLLNNDTLVQPGWLSALVERVERAPEIGIVAPMLLYPDGSVQEAGAIIFQDASGWNYGRGLDPNAGTFNYVRDIDYGSGACLLVRAQLWRELHGYDELYLPMYYEDVDLCFAARDRGFRVVYEPAARVVHVEGASAGTDPGAGGKRHQELNRPKFASKWRAQLTADQLPRSRENVRQASDRNSGPHVLVVDHRVPFPDRDAGSLRMKYILAILLDIGCRVTFIPDNLDGAQPYTRELQDIGVEVLYGDVHVAAEVASIGPRLRLAVLSRPVVAPRYFDVIREHAPGATIAYDTVDLHFVREGRRAALGNGRDGKVATLRELELGLIRGADVTLTVSDEERFIVSSHVPEASIIVVPVANAISETVPPADARRGVLFVGSFEHPPNADAAVVLVKSVMPLVWRDLGPVPVKIVGTRPPEEVCQLASSNVEVTGWVKDLSPLYDESRVMSAPLLYGAGMKGKVTQSLAAGLPVVTTPVGAEGLHATDGADLMIAEDPAEQAARIVQILTDDELWGRLSKAGQDVAARVFSLAIMRKRLEELLAVALRSP